MKSAIPERSSWTRGRLLAVVGALFIFQAGLLFLFGDRSRPPPRLSTPSVRFRNLGASVSESQLMRQYFVGDPAVFPLPNPHGFSGRGWMDQQPLEYRSENQLEPPDWLPLDTARLGAHLPVLPPGSQPILSDLSEQRDQQEETPPPFLVPEVIATQSVFLLEGDLRNRLLGAAPRLTNWTSPQLLTNSAVQIAVDPAGEVVVSRLKARSGLEAADLQALDQTRALRFRPSPSAGTRWGEAVFQWQTLAPAEAGPLKTR